MINDNTLSPLKTIAILFRRAEKVYVKNKGRSSMRRRDRNILIKIFTRFDFKYFWTFLLEISDVAFAISIIGGTK